MYLAEIWRYPVKSMAGESLEHAAVTLSGIAGDRLVQVYSERGRIVTARTHPGLLAHRATLDQTGEPLVDGRLWTDPSVLADVRRIGGPQARLARDEDPETRFDVLPLRVATDGAIAAFGRDLRRLRPNLVIGGVHGLDERHWPGVQLKLRPVDPPISRMSQLRKSSSAASHSLNFDRTPAKRSAWSFQGAHHPDWAAPPARS